MKTATQTFAGKFENLEKVSRFVEESARPIGFDDPAVLQGDGVGVIVHR